jgi:outer membrane protein assembly factor BamB
MKRVAMYLAVLIVGGMALAAAQAADWPQWQGPDRNAISKETGLLKEWPKDGPPLAWKIKGLGGGYSAPAVVGGKVYGISIRGENEVLWALSEADGKELWAKPLGSAYRQGPSQGVEGPGCTPTVDGDRMYVIGAAGDIACLQVADGKILWQKSMVRDFGGRVPQWRYNESPLVDGDKVVCTPGAADAIMVALNKMTGETIWKSQMPAAVAAAGGAGGGGAGKGGKGGKGGMGGGGGGGAGYASAIAIDFEGQRQYIQFTARALIGVAAADGKFLWRYDKPANGQSINCAAPIYQDGLVFASSAYNTGGGAVKLSKDAGGIKAEEVYFTKSMQNHHGGMVVVDGCLYGANGGNEGGNLACLDFKTGKVLWDGKGVAPAKGAILFADGRIYYRTEEGVVVLVEPNSKAYTERGRFQQPDRSKSPDWAHPVLANGKLFLRDQDVLFCYDVKAK